MADGDAAFFSATPDPASPSAFGRSFLTTASTLAVAVVAVLLIGAGVVEASESPPATPGPEVATTLPAEELQVEPILPEPSESVDPAPFTLPPSADPSPSVSATASSPSPFPVPSPSPSPSPSSSPSPSRSRSRSPSPSPTTTLSDRPQEDPSSMPPFSETPAEPVAEMRGLDCEQARQEVAAAGLRPRLTGSDIGVVRDQSPGPGERMSPGSTVDLFCEGF